MTTPQPTPLTINGVTIELADILAVLKGDNTFATAVRMQALERMFADVQTQLVTLQAEVEEQPKKKAKVKGES